MLFYLDFDSILLPFLGNAIPSLCTTPTVYSGYPGVWHMLGLARWRKQRARFQARGIRLVRMLQGIILFYAIAFWYSCLASV
jgi:hypothetical protein